MDVPRVNRKTEGTMIVTKAMENAVAALRTALARVGAGCEQTAYVLGYLGLDAPRADNAERKPKAKTVSTDKEAKTTKPGVYRVVGVKRLYLKKTTPATGSYFVRWRIPGDKSKRPAIGLGSIADVSLADAITRAEDIHAGLRKGVSPRDVREGYAAKVAAETAAAKAEAALPTVAEMAERYVGARMNDKKNPWKGRYAATNWLNPLKAHAFPAIGSLKVNEVTPKHIAETLAAMADKGLASNKTRSSLRSLFKWLIERGIRDDKLGNPAGASVISVGKANTQHYDRVEPKKAPAVFRELLAAAPGNTAISAWVFMVLTAARPSEAITAQWKDVDRDAKVWRNPVSKTGKTLEVPLTDTAIAILDEQRSRSSGELIFAGAAGGKLAHSNFAGAPKRAGIDAATPHGWRSVCSDALSEHCGISRDVREAVLGHALDATEAAYRRGDAFRARAVAKQLRAELPALPNGLSSRDVKRAEEMAAARVLEKMLRGQALSVPPPDAAKAMPALLRSAPA
jgi:integrase